LRRSLEEVVVDREQGPMVAADPCSWPASFASFASSFEGYFATWPSYLLDSVARPGLACQNSFAGAGIVAREEAQTLAEAAAREEAQSLVGLAVAFSSLLLLCYCSINKVIRMTALRKKEENCKPEEGANDG